MIDLNLNDEAYTECRVTGMGLNTTRSRSPSFTRLSNDMRAQIFTEFHGSIGQYFSLSPDKIERVLEAMASRFLKGVRICADTIREGIQADWSESDLEGELRVRIGLDE